MSKHRFYPTPVLKIPALITLIVLLSNTLLCCSHGSGEDFEYPQYSGAPVAQINGGVPFFTESEITDVDFESYSPLDALGRCGAATASVGKDLMPKEERGDISSVIPTGFYCDGKSNNNVYSFIEGGYVYNRCHLLGYQLTAENANERNLITGTYYFNVHGMLPYENKVAEYVISTGNHVMLRVTPIYEGYDFVARGVLMEGYSVEDDGRGVEFCVFVYNLQPGVVIDYFNGTNRPDIKNGYGEDTFTPAPTYVLNLKSKKYHLPECYYASVINDVNSIKYYGTVATFRDEYSDYAPCGVCLP